MSAEGAQKCDCEATLDNPLSVMVVGINAQILKERKYHSYLQEGRPRELQARQPHLDPIEGDETAHPANHSLQMTQNWKEWLT